MKKSFVSLIALVIFMTGCTGSNNSSNPSPSVMENEDAVVEISNLVN